MKLPFRTAVFSLTCVALVGIANAQQTNQPNPGQRPMNSPPGAPTDMPRQDNLSRPAGQSDSFDFDAQLKEIARDPKTASDKIFVLGCAQESVFEVEVARQAEQRAQNPQVKLLAQQIVREHQQASQQLNDVAKQLNIEVPSQLSPMQQEMLKIFAATPADQYEKWFTVMTQAHHASAMLANRGVARITDNPIVREYAQKQATMLTRHFDQAQAAAVSLGLPSGIPEALPASGRIEPMSREPGGIAPTREPGNPNTPRP